MRRATFSGLRLIVHASAGLPPRARLHILGRYVSCPFDAVVAALPRAADVLDVGAGHGLFARLAVEHGARRVVALEPDLRKLPYVLRHPGIRWVAGFDPAIQACFDAVVLCDVLYRVPLAERDALLARLFQRLRPGGRLLIKELDPGRRLKAGWNVVQEAVADRVFRLTLGSGLAYEAPDVLGRRLAGAGFAGVTAVPIDRGYPHAHILYTAHRQT